LSAPDCAFCDIAKGSEQDRVVLDDERHVAFLDHRPLFHGHCLLIPREHRETLLDLHQDELAPFFGTAQLLARAVEESMGAKGTFVAMNNRVSQSVPHLHVHVVPRRPKDGLRGFFWPRTKYEDEAQMREVRDAVREAIEGLRG
jgi:histidine triad (HIT) family protein